jgi:hypothetical protein
MPHTIVVSIQRRLAQRVSCGPPCPDCILPRHNEAASPRTGEFSETSSNILAAAVLRIDDASDGFGEVRSFDRRLGMVVVPSAEQLRNPLTLWVPRLNEF